MEHHMLESVNMDSHMMRCSCGSYIYYTSLATSADIAAAFNHHLRTEHKQGENA